VFDHPSKRFLGILALIAVVALIVVIGTYVFHFAPHSLSSDPDDWAKFGEYVGGTLGAFYGLLAVIGVLVTVLTAIDANRESSVAHSNELRPWMQMTALRLSVQLSYSQGTWHTEIAYRMKNTGRTPAKRVTFDVHLIPDVIAVLDPVTKLPTEGTDIAAELRKFASQSQRVNEITKGPFGQLLFPDAEVPGRFIIDAGGSEFEQLSAPGYGGQFVLLTCITYQSSIDDAWHETAQAYAYYLTSDGKPSRIKLENGEFTLGNRQCVLVSHSRGDNYVT
jgi:hypothetical protein